MIRTIILTTFGVGVWAGTAAAQPLQKLGATPVPTAKELEEEREFVAGVVDPKNTLDMIVGRPRVIMLKATPHRTQVADPTVMSLNLLEPHGRQLTVLGDKAGTTVLNVWFPDPKDKDKEVILSYLVRVLPDPEAKARLIAQYNALAAEVNRAFPNSLVRLTPVADKPVLSGQAHDVSDAAKILRVIQK